MRWTREIPHVAQSPAGLQWVGAVVRVLVFFLVSLIVVIFLAIARLSARLMGRRRAGAGIIRFWAGTGLWCCGLSPEIQGEPMRHHGAIVANHISWIDIFTLHAVADIVFVSKAEVSGWPFIGLLARSGNTIFIDRRANQARAQMELLSRRMATGDRLCIFPEGTSTDGSLVLDFRSSLFGAFYENGGIAEMWVQPVSIVYVPRDGLAADFYGWWGDMEFGEHLLSVFGKSRRGRVRILFHPPVKATDFASRKSLAAHCADVVRAGHAALSAKSDGAAM